MSDSTELPTFAHWHRTTVEEPIRYVGLALRKDGFWEIGVQTPFDEIACEFEEVCQGVMDEEDIRAFVVVDVLDKVVT